VLKSGVAQTIRNGQGARISALPTVVWQGERMIKSSPIHFSCCENNEFMTQSKMATQPDPTFRNCQQNQYRSYMSSLSLFTFHLLYQIPMAVDLAVDF
jgi:hypothetical protein